MTLSVNAYWTDAEGVEHELPLASDLAGFESTRKSFYAGPAAIAKGLRLLPQLREYMELAIDAESFDELLRELDVLAEIARTDDTYESYWQFRLDNLRAAVAAASAHGSTGFVRIG